ncbi:esterase family protein [Dyadobacter psychrotolerans]|uniref:Esterase n=1 Tax=Dyadobacter psychrotolerans TaxID=2541721 RepID=A0A4V2Z4M4_9BACT|nr:alpha/beta hydrolase-fold protein [Dyadobacter psychrotolerans]TDE17158.1 esterase [Dyadobacter psychrotolerans]
MHRAYHKWFSPVLNREMELLVFGERGLPVIFFPTRSAHFYDLENWKVVDAMQQKISAGEIQVYCVDSVDQESFYSNASADRKIVRHMQYESYILNEVVPLVKRQNKHRSLAAAGCSLGGYHAVNIALKHPNIFNKVVGMSARYDLTKSLEFFADLFNGYFDENIYYNMPNHFVPRITDKKLLNQLGKMDITMVVGREDSFLPDNEKLSYSLNQIGVGHQFHVWEEEAHKPRYWREMVKLYL